MNKKKNYELRKCLFLIMAVCVLGVSLLCGCGKERTQGSQELEEAITQETSVNENTESFEESEETVKEQNVLEENTTVEAPIEVSATETAEVEMVDFETWAKQEGNDEVCLVIWNEELGVQDIMPTLQETKKAYEIQEGDIFAIPYRECIINFGFRDQGTWIWPDKDYYELPLQKGKVSIVDIVYQDEKGETIILTYTFK